jgi:hypothetical protein
VTPLALAFTNRAINPAFMRLLRTSLGGRVLGRRLAVVEYTGRRSGAARGLVTLYECRGATVTVPIAAPIRKRWWRNFLEPTALRIHIAGISYDGTARALSDPIRVVVELTADRGRSPR